MEVNMQTHPHQIVGFKIVAFIKRILDVLFCNFEENKCFKEGVQSFRKEMTWGFENGKDPNVQRERALHSLFREFAVVVATGC